MGDATVAKCGMQENLKQFSTLVVTLVAVLSYSGASQGHTVQGVDFSDFVVLDILPNTNLQLSTAGDIYVYAPTGLFASEIELFAEQGIVFGIPVNVTGELSACTIPIPGVCVHTPPTIYQDVVVRILGTTGSLDFDSEGSIVIDAIPIPEPSSLVLVAFGLLALNRCVTGRGGRQQKSKRTDTVATRDAWAWIGNRS